MPQIQSISITKPCSQSWRQMEQREQGRHCAHCEKIVIDFSAMTNDEILAYMANANNVCGRISQTQLTSINYSLKAEQSPKFAGWKRWAIAAALFGAGITGRVNAYANPAAIAATMQVPNDSTHKAMPVADTLSTRSLTYHIAGRVIAADDGYAIPGATIRVKGTNFTVQADVNGRFQLNTENPQVVLIVSCIGFTTQELQPRLKKYKKVKIELQSNSMMLGGMGVIINAPKSRLKMLYQSVVLPVSQLFS